jgi:transcriptional regulator of aromatic amino acid metabolism
MTVQSTAKKLYETDFNFWLETTAKLLRERQFNQIDYDNLVEEIEAIGRSERNALESNLRVLLMHLLKWKYQPSRRSNSWKSSIIEHSLRINKAFKYSPSLRRYFNEIFEETYQDARLLAAGETGLSKETFPEHCLFKVQDILNPEYLPE